VLPDTGIVVIGRNEGERLLSCLDSVRGRASLVVYVDSASVDGSPAAARARGALVLELDPACPLSAARGRNAGWRTLHELRPGLTSVLFLDGDCRLVEGFLEGAQAELERDPGLGAVCGRRRELRPEASPYNRVVDCEWNTPPGESDVFGGDVLVRMAALEATGGYDESLAAGEDPELAFRMRRAGWRILRLDRDMTLHDVGLSRFGAWWRRHARGGQAYAHGAALHLGEPGRYNQRACLSILAWGLALPVLALGALPFTGGLSAGLLAAYLWLFARVRRGRIGRGDGPREASLYALLVTVGKLAEAQGVLRCLHGALRGRRPLPLEYRDKRRRAAA
jgi:GT2 family glycosyltransferase